MIPTEFATFENQNSPVPSQAYTPMGKQVIQSSRYAAKKVNKKDTIKISIMNNNLPQSLVTP